MIQGPTFAEIKDELVKRIGDVVRTLAPGGAFKGDYWIAKSPLRADRHAGSFWIRVKGTGIGAWRDEATGETGDIVNLVGAVHRCADRSETRRVCLKLLGWQGGALPKRSAEDLARMKREAEERTRREEAADRARLAKNSRRAFAMWLEAEKLTPANFPGSILDRYFRSRAIDLVGGLLERGRALPGAIRFVPDHDWRDDETGELIGLPCMIALYSNPDGSPRAVHRTWLKPDGSGKAELDPNRKSWPNWNSGVIRIAKGAGELSPEQAAKAGRRGPLVVTEGIEDALAVMIACPAHRVWAAGTLGNIRNVPKLACVSSITICADNDWHEPQAVASLERGLQELRRHRLPVNVARSWRGKDVNDLMRGE